MPSSDTPEPLRFASQLYLQAPAGKVWEALVDPAVASLYYLAPLLYPLKKAGGQVAYGNGESVMISGIILDHRPGAALRHTFAFMQPDGTRGSESTVLYDLEAIGEELTLLRLVHGGFEGGDQGDFESISSGWPVILSSLKTLLETGRPLQWPRRLPGHAQVGPNAAASGVR